MKLDQKNKNLDGDSWKLLFSENDKGRTLTNGSEEKKADVDSSDFTSKRWRRQTMYPEEKAGKYSPASFIEESMDTSIQGLEDNKKCKERHISVANNSTDNERKLKKKTKQNNNNQNRTVKKKKTVQIFQETNK